MMTEKESFIQLKKDSTIRLGIKDMEGNDTGEYLEFNMEDIELPLKYQDLLEKDKLNKKTLRDKMVIIDKKEDHKGKKLMSHNEEEKIKALNEFFKKEEEVYNIFLGEDGVKKLLAGHKLSWTTLQAIDELIEEQILPHLQVSIDDISKKVKEKYAEAKERGVLE